MTEQTKTVQRYPEHEKLQMTQPDADSIGQFLEWLQDQNLTICYWRDYEFFGGEWEPDRVSVEKRLAAYFRIDLEKIADEKEAMLAEYRRMNGGAS